MRLLCLKQAGDRLLMTTSEGDEKPPNKRGTFGLREKLRITLPSPLTRPPHRHRQAEAMAIINQQHTLGQLIRSTCCLGSDL